MKLLRDENVYHMWPRPARQNQIHLPPQTYLVSLRELRAEEKSLRCMIDNFFD